MDTTDRRTKRLVKKFNKLDYPHQYYLVEQFLKKNAKLFGNYYIALINFYQKEKEENDLSL